jgi:hypothetical protein
MVEHLPIKRVSPTFKPQYCKKKKKRKLKINKFLVKFKYSLWGLEMWLSGRVCAEHALSPQVQAPVPKI